MIKAILYLILLLSIYEVWSLRRTLVREPSPAPIEDDTACCQCNGGDCSKCSASQEQSTLVALKTRIDALMLDDPSPDDMASALALIAECSGQPNKVDS